VEAAETVLRVLVLTPLQALRRPPALFKGLSTSSEASLCGEIALSSGGSDEKVAVLVLGDGPAVMEESVERLGEGLDGCSIVARRARR
jgi:CTP:molybdopterin cytidylyltransferase MocA